MNNKLILIGLASISLLWMTGCNEKKDQNSEPRKRLSGKSGKNFFIE